MSFLGFKVKLADILSYFERASHNFIVKRGFIEIEIFTENLWARSQAS
jgi:hypothetical protein